MKNKNVDVLIVGAGISGICMAHYLQTQCSNKTYQILEGRDDCGGTWDLYQYPGIRSDSAMTSFGYEFKPWLSPQQFAGGADIKNYLKETVQEFGIKDKITYGIHVTAANWSNKTKRWKISAVNKKTNEALELECNFLVTACGYYDYNSAYQPEFKDVDKFEGRFFHPQFWPKNLDVENKNVLIIGSGATAATLLPSLAKLDTKHVTLLQRTPSYFLIYPREDYTIHKLSKYIGEKAAFRYVRAKATFITDKLMKFCYKFPKLAKWHFLRGLKKHLPQEMIDKHFTPDYYPLQQRPLILPDADFLEALKNGSGSVVTDHIDHFTPDGIQLKSGKHLDADIIVSATGLKLLPIGGVKIFIDGEAVHLNDHYLYKSGSMMSGVPNLATIIGLGAASWTDKASLIAQYLCRIINYMDEHGYDSACPDPNVSEERRPFVVNFISGYIKRAVNDFPSQGQSKPWTIGLDFIRETKYLLKDPIDDGTLVFEKTDKT